MKKIVLFNLLTLAALATTSCSNEEIYSNESQDNAIEFSTYVGRDAITRGSVFTTDDMQTDGFGVYAFYTEKNSWETAKETATPNFMCNQQVTKSGEDWTYSPLKYWPNNTDDKVSFFAYAPYNDGTDTDISASQSSTAGATISFTVKDAVKDQIDLTVAEAKTDQNKQTITGDVNFTFKHVLSRIGLNVEAMFDKVNSDQTGGDDNNTDNGTKATETTIKVTKVELIGKFDKDGTIDLTNSEWSGISAPTDDVTYTWSYNETEAESNFDNDVAKNVTTTKQKLNANDSYAMIIPQNFTGDNKIKLVVTYTVTTTDSNLDGGQSEITNTITSDAFNFNFEQGKAYTFNLHLGMTSVKLSATVGDWDEVNPGTVVNVPINTGSN